MARCHARIMSNVTSQDTALSTVAQEQQESSELLNPTHVVNKAESLDLMAIQTFHALQMAVNA